MDDTVLAVVRKVLQKLDGFVDTVEAEKLNPQAMKHITATLKDIRDLTEENQPTESQITVIFDHPEWRN